MTARILLLDTGKEWGGGTNSMLELLKRLDRSRYQVTALFYRNYPKGSGSDLRRELEAIGIPLEIMASPRQPWSVKLAKELLRGLFSLFPRLKRRQLHAIERLWRINPLARRIAARLKSGEFDLLYLNNQPSSNLEGYLAGELAGVPVVQHARIAAGLIPEEAAVVNRVARCIVCVSAGVRDNLVAQGVAPALCRVVYNAIDGSQSLPDPIPLPACPAGAVVIGSVGSLIRRKGNDQLLRAAAGLLGEAQAFHLCLVGEGPERAALEGLCRELGIEGRASFAGFQARPMEWMAAMDVLVLASASEGLPRVILEAMLLGKPVIATDIVGSRELVAHGETGLLYPDGDVEKLAAALDQLIRSPETRRSMGMAGRSRVLRDFAIARYISGVEAVFAETLS